MLNHARAGTATALLVERPPPGVVGVVVGTEGERASGEGGEGGEAGEAGEGGEGGEGGEEPLLFSMSAERPIEAERGSGWRAPPAGALPDPSSSFFP